MTDDADVESDRSESRPYVNGLQEWIGESKLAGICLGLWEIGAAATVVAGLLRTDLLFIGGGAVWLLVSLFVHFWRDELAPEMRHPRGETP